VYSVKSNVALQVHKLRATELNFAQDALSPEKLEINNFVQHVLHVDVINYLNNCKDRYTQYIFLYALKDKD